MGCAPTDALASLVPHGGTNIDTIVVMDNRFLAYSNFRIFKKNGKEEYIKKRR